MILFNHGIYACFLINFIGKELSSLISLFKALGGGWGPLEEGNGSAVKRHQSALTDGGPYEEKGNEAHERIHQ